MQEASGLFPCLHDAFARTRLGRVAAELELFSEQPTVNTEFQLGSRVVHCTFAKEILDWIAS